jgi:hypothetical protein
VGIITVAGTRCSPRRAVMVAGFASERKGRTNDRAQRRLDLPQFREGMHYEE